MYNNREITSICTFCCKQISNCNNVPLDNRNDTYKFFTFLSRFLGTENTLLKSLQLRNNSDCDLNFEICPDCGIVGDTFCDLYHQLKCIEIQIQWKVQTLAGVMKVAKRVPSRLKNLKEIFARISKANMDVDYHGFMQTRNKIVAACDQSHSKCFPKIILKRLKTRLANSPANSMESTAALKSDKLDMEDLQESFCTWIVSFAAVVSLLTLPTVPISYSGSFPSEDVETVADTSNFGKECLTSVVFDNSNASNLLCFLKSSEVLEAEISSNFDTEAEMAIGYPENSILSESNNMSDNDDVDMTNVSNSNNRSSFAGEEQDLIFEQKTDLVQFTESSCTKSELIEELLSNEDKDSRQSSSTNSLYNSHNATTGFNDNNEKSELNMAEDDDYDNKSENPGSNQDVKLDIFIENDQDLIDEKNGMHQVNVVLKSKNASKRNGNEKTFPCQHCSETFPRKQHLSIHIRKTHPQKIGPYFCKLCNRRYPSYNFYLMHRKTLMHNRKLKLYNEIKGHTFRDDIIISKNQNEQPKNLNPIKRKADSESEQTSSEDEAETLGSRKYSLRSRQRQSVATVVEHEDISSSESSSSENKNVYSSDEISSETSDEEETPQRKPRTPQPNKKIWRCSKEGCNNIIRSALAYQDHQKLHEPGKYKCMFCTNKWGLVRHRREVHYESWLMRRIVCPVIECGKIFNENGQLEEHQKLHGNFSCHFCSITTDFAPELATHELEHNADIVVTSDRFKFKCPRCCFESFCKPTYITHHLEVHLGVTDNVIPCKVCNRKFRHSDLLLTHFQKNHKIGENESKKPKVWVAPGRRRPQERLPRQRLRV